MKVVLGPGSAFEVRPGESLLEAALRQGFDCPRGCRNGNCLVCVAQLRAGRVRQAGQLVERGEVLCCQAEPLADCRLDWPRARAPGQWPAVDLRCQVVGCEPLGADAFRVALRAPAGRPPRYHAGQSLQLFGPEGRALPFHLASAPAGGRELEFLLNGHAGAATSLVDWLARQREVRVRLPFGPAHLAVLPAAPLLLFAQGAGIAQALGLLEHCLASDFRHPLQLHWFAAREADFHRLPRAADWAAWPALRVRRWVGDDPDRALAEVFGVDFPVPGELHACASGPAAWVQGLRRAWEAAGGLAHHLRADVPGDAPVGGLPARG